MPMLPLSTLFGDSIQKLAPHIDMRHISYHESLINLNGEPEI
jgi:hypothetical protein